jgi:hypothetical protein
MKPVSMNRKMSACLALLAASLLAFNGFSQDPNFHIYLAFGQSNMEGYPAIDAQDKTGVSPRFQLLPAVNWSDNSRTKGTWTTAIPPLCRSSTGLCPCDYFGRTLVDSLPESIKIGIINVSVAGCSIKMFDKANYQSYISGQADWMKTIANEYGGNPYGRLVEMGKLAQKDGVIRGILLHQGETDAGDAQWGSKVKGVYDNLIQDLGLDASKTPLLAGDLLAPNTNIQKLPTFLQNSYVISSQGLQGRDQYHFTTASYRDFGKRYGVKMLALLGNTGVAANKEKTRAGYALGNGVELRNGTVSFSFEIPERAPVTLTIYTLSGKEIAVIADEEYAKGRHTIQFRQKAMRTGVFLLKMKSGRFSATRTILAGR